MTIRVLTISGEWGGAEIHTLALVRTLVARGHDVTIVELGRHAYSEGCAGAPIPVRVLRPRGSDPRPVESVGHGEWLGLLRPLGGVAVLAKGFIDAGSPVLDLAARRAFDRFLTIEHLTCPMPPLVRRMHFGIVPGAGFWWYRTLLRRMARHFGPEAVICVSDAVRRELQKQYRFPARKLVTVRNGVDLVRFTRDAEARANRRNAWGLPEASLVFGAVGRLSPMKGYNVALRSFASVLRRRDGTDLRLVLAGDGPLKDDLRRLAQELGVADRVVFPGFTRKPHEFYSALDVFVMPSIREGLPLALLEAMACGCCPIATSVGGIPEVLDASDLGWLVPSGDMTAFEAAMLDAVDRRAELAAIADRARRQIVERFDERTQLAAIAAVIERAAPERTARIPAARRAHPESVTHL